MLGDLGQVTDKGPAPLSSLELTQCGGFVVWSGEAAQDRECSRNSFGLGALRGKEELSWVDPGLEEKLCQGGSAAAAAAHTPRLGGG